MPISEIKLAVYCHLQQVGINFFYLKKIVEEEIDQKKKSRDVKASAEDRNSHYKKNLQNLCFFAQCLVSITFWSRNLFFLS